MLSESVVAGSVLFLCGLGSQVWFKQKKTLWPKDDKAVPKKINTVQLIHVIVGLAVLFLPEVVYLLPFSTGPFYVGSYLVVQFFLISGLVYYVMKSGLSQLFIAEKLYIKLGVLVYLISLPWIGLTSLAYESLIHSTGLGTIENVGLFHTETNIYEALIFLAIFIAPFKEEIIVRGIFYNFTRRWISPLSSLILISILFGLGHINHELNIVSNANIFLKTFVISLFITYLYQKTSSLYACMAFHFINNSIGIIIFSLAQKLQFI